MQISRDIIEKRRKLLKRARLDARAARDSGGEDQEHGEQVSEESSSKKQRKSSGSRSVSPAALVTPPAGSKTTKKKRAEAALSNAAADKQQRREEKKRRRLLDADGDDGGVEVETLLAAAELVAKRCREDPADIDMLGKFGKLVTALREKHGIRIGSPFKDPSDAARDAVSSSRRGSATAVGTGSGRTQPSKHFSDIPPTGGADGGRTRRYGYMDSAGDFIAALSGAGNQEVSPPADGRGGELSIAPRKPYETLGGVATEGTIRALSREPRKAGSQGGPDVLATMMTATPNDQVSGGGEPGCDMQIETTAFLAAAMNPTHVEIDRFVGVSLRLNTTASKKMLRPYRHNDKKHKDLSFEKILTDRVDELYSALSNYVGLLDAVVLLKPEIRQALLRAVEAANEFARDAPHSGKILRSIGAYFFEEVEDVLRTVGYGTPVEDIVAKIDDIDFNDRQAAHTSCIMAYHITKYNEEGTKPKVTTTKTPPATPSPTPADNGGGGGGGGARGTKRERDRVKKERRRAGTASAATGADPAAPTTSRQRTDICPWWCSERGCDPTKKTGGRTCQPARHVMPTREADRLATLASMNKFALTARADFPASCPP